MGSTKVYLRAETHRVECPDHGVHTQKVSWARPGSRFTYNFEEIVAWLSLNLPRTAAAEYMRISWNNVGPILTRIEKELSAKSENRFDNLVRIGIDETSFKKVINTSLSLSTMIREMLYGLEKATQKILSPIFLNRLPMSSERVLNLFQPTVHVG